MKYKHKRLTCLFKISQLFSSGSDSWLREFLLGCASRCTKYKGLDPLTAPWSGKIPAADTGSSTWYCQTTCIVSFWKHKGRTQVKTGVLVLRFLLSKNIDRKTGGYKEPRLYTRVAIKIGAFRRKASHTTRIDDVCWELRARLRLLIKPLVKFTIENYIRWTIISAIFMRMLETKYVYTCNYIYILIFICRYIDLRVI